MENEILDQFDINSMLEGNKLKELLLDYDTKVELFTGNNIKMPTGSKGVEGDLCINYVKHNYGKSYELKHDKHGLNVTHTEIIHFVNVEKGESGVWLDFSNNRGKPDRGIHWNFKSAVPKVIQDRIITELEIALAVIKENNEKLTIKKSANDYEEDENYDKKKEVKLSREEEDKQLLMKLRDSMNKKKQ